MSAGLLGTFTSRAQFTITENFKNSTAINQIVMGGSPSAYLTAGNIDPEGDGWLRLTNAQGNQKGFAYIDESFPSGLGVLVDFEFKAWRSSSDGRYNGADGFSVFLFDGSISGSNFSLGGYGGSLGYAPLTPSVPTGLSGGYIGIGLDEYGNFSRATEGRNGGNGSKPNSIVLRGPTTSSASTTNAYIAGYQLTTNDLSNEGIDYNNPVATRPDDNTFYRRMQITVTKEGAQYRIIVKMAKTPNGDFTEYINKLTTTPPPSTLKLGFAASTGGGFNNHEIRNLVVTTPGGARIDNSPSVPNTTVGSAVQFTVNAYNSTNAPLSDFLLTNTFYDGDGNIIPSDQLQIDNIEFLDNGDANNVMTDHNIGEGTTTANFNLDGASATTGDAVGTFIIHATVLKKPAGGIITCKSTLDDSNTGITDDDPTNNVSTSEIKINESDLDVSVSHDGDYVAGKDNTLTVHIANNGPDATSTPTVLHETLPEGVTFNGTVGDQGNGWTISVQDNVVTATYNGDPVASGSDLPDLQIPISLNEDLAGTTIISTIQVDNAADYTLNNNLVQEAMTVKSPIGLPVGLLNFTGYQSGNTNILNWRTATEINNKGFNVQRSTDNAASWKTIGFVNGNGTSSSEQKYTYCDNEGGLFEHATYRLEQVNSDGKASLLDKVVTIQGKSTVLVKVAPNPARGSFKISGLIPGDIVTIYTASGKLVKQLTAASNTEQVTTERLSKGLYFIKVKNKSTGKIISKKVIIQ